MTWGSPIPAPPRAKFMEGSSARTCQELFPTLQQWETQGEIPGKEEKTPSVVSTTHSRNSHCQSPARAVLGAVRLCLNSGFLS